MKVILIGYPGSQCIVPASRYLASKYLNGDYHDFFYLNYKGEINGWAKYVSTFLSYFDDKEIIFALDDYLLADYVDQNAFDDGWNEMNDNVVCVKLCHSTLEEHLEYPVTTQYCIWEREYLIWLLNSDGINTPWEFEMVGSYRMKQYKGDKSLHRPCLKYFTNSSISSRWKGVRLDGLKDEDIKYIKENNLINE